MSTVRWGTLTREEIGALCPGAVLLLPVAAIEQHGPHLGVSADTTILEALVALATRHLPRELDVLIAPTLCYGASDHHLPFGGTLSLTTQTFRQVLSDLLRSAAGAGCRRVLILNGHGGNTDTCRLVATEAAPLHEIVVATVSYWDLAATHDPAFPVPGHAGRFETSLILAVAPELVRSDAQRPPPSVHHDLAPSATHIADPGFWRQIDGFTDDPRAANTEEGTQLLAYLARAVADTIVAVGRASACTRRTTSGAA